VTRSALLFGLLVGIALWGAPPVAAQDGEREKVRATLASDFDALSPGATTTLVLRLQIKPEWHVYWLNPGDAGVPTKVELTLPKGIASAGPRWPAPKRLIHDGFVDFVYEDELIVLVPLEVKSAERVGTKVSLGVKVSWLVCKEVCIPGQAELSLELPVRAKDAPRAAQAAVAKQIQGAQARFTTPLPKEVQARFRGQKLELAAPGAKGLTWFPLSPEAAGPTDLEPLAGKGPQLSVAYPADVRQSKRIRGLLAIRGNKHTTYHWVEVSSSTPPE
jgi:DsbC/DsbD-like thiol-disulfide interchange protein